VLGSPFGAGSTHGRSSFGRRAVTQERVDERLIANAGLGRKGLEVGDGRFVKPDRDGALEARRVWIRAGSTEVVFFSRDRAPCSSYAVRSWGVAFRTEMM